MYWEATEGGFITKIRCAIWSAAGRASVSECTAEWEIVKKDHGCSVWCLNYGPIQDTSGSHKFLQKFLHEFLQDSPQESSAGNSSRIPPDITSKITFWSGSPQKFLQEFPKFLQNFYLEFLPEIYILAIPSKVSIQVPSDIFSRNSSIILFRNFSSNLWLKTVWYLFFFWKFLPGSRDFFRKFIHKILCRQFHHESL